MELEGTLLIVIFSSEVETGGEVVIVKAAARNICTKVFPVDLLRTGKNVKLRKPWAMLYV